MALEQIIQRIEENSAEKIKEIEAGASAEAERISSRAREEIKKLKERKNAETAAGIESEKRRRLALKRLELRNAALRLKRDILNEVFEEAFERVRNLPDADYMKLMEKLFLNWAEPGKGSIHISKRDKGRMTMEFIERAAGRLRDTGKECEYRLAADFADIEGGFILETESTKIDCSLEALFVEIRDKLQKRTGDLLFENG